MLLLVTLCILQILNDSTFFNIKNTELVYKSTSLTNFDYSLQENCGSIELEKTGFTNEISIDISGSYRKVELSSDIKNSFGNDAAINYMWLNDSNKIILCFSKYDLYIFSAENHTLIKSVNYAYNRGKFEFFNENNVQDFYNCNLLYSQGVTPEAEDESQDNNENTSGTTNQETKNLKNYSKLVNFIDTYFTPWLFSGIFGTVFLIISVVLIFSRTKFTLYGKYKKNLKAYLFPQEHAWLGNNSPLEIYISARVFIENTFHEYNLLEYFSPDLLKTTSGNYIILGNAGEGKTFAVSRLALAVLEGFSSNKSRKKEQKKSQNSIPVLLNFSQLENCNNDEDILNIIYDKISQIAGFKKNIIDKFLYFKHKKNVLNTIEHLLDLGKFIIFVDGYDEIENTEQRLRISNVLTHFMDSYDKSCFIITSRITVYKEEGFANIPEQNTLYLSPLSKEQIHKFLSKWNFPKGKTSSDLFQRIINTRQLSEIVTNPLLLTMITHTYCSQFFKMVNSKTLLYKNCCECLLSEWEKRKFNILRIKRYKTLKNTDVKINLLSILAFELFSFGNKPIPEEDLLKLWSSQPTEKIFFHGKVAKVLEEIINQSSILERVNNTVRFRHNSFYEYFTALYFYKNNCDTKKMFENVISNSNILFFYFSMISDEAPVSDFILKNLKHNKLVCDILLERHITNDRVVKVATKSLIHNTSYIDITDIRALGYLAKQYLAVQTPIREVLVNKLMTATDEKEKVNIIIGLMIFCDEKTLAEIFSYTSIDVDLKYLIEYSQESINDFSYIIIQILAKHDDKIKFIEELSKSYRFEAIYNIYKQSGGEIKDFAIIGLLYMSKEPELLNWLESKKFFESIDETTQSIIIDFQNKYGWNDELSEEALSNLYALIYLSASIISNGFSPNSELIENKTAFLLCMLISDLKEDLYYELIKIDDIKMNSYVELSYHWNLIKKHRKKFFKINSGIIDAVILDRIIFTSVYFWLFIKMILFVFNCININELISAGWTYNIDIHSHALIPFDMLYILIMCLMIIFIRIVNNFIKNLDYGFYAIIISYSFSLFVFLLYCILTKNIAYRLLTLILLLLISCFEILKHKNNYPSFKEPQYNRIVDFLKSPYHFNDIHIG